MKPLENNFLVTESLMYPKGFSQESNGEKLARSKQTQGKEVAGELGKQMVYTDSTEM